MSFWSVIWACICWGVAMESSGAFASPLKVFAMALSMYVTGAVIYAGTATILGWP
jgi:hypothetical protein